LRLAGHGIEIELPRRWSGQVFARQGAARLHAGSFPVVVGDGEFGDASTGAMPGVAAFVALAEYLAGRGLAPGTGLFSSRRLPLPLDPLAFSARRLAHPRPGQVGTQHFYTDAERPFCLYVVIAGDRIERRGQLAIVDRVLRSLRISERA
jgi:hypothetical protein